VSDVGFLLNLSFPAEARHVVALHDLILQAVRQAGGDEGRARDFAEQAAAVLRESANGKPGTGEIAISVELGPPIQVRVGSRTLTLDNPAEAGPHEPS
jgi:hypothetical protein